MQHYYFEQKGRVTGPLTLQEIKNRNLDAGTLVWNRNLKTWTPARDIRELNGSFAGIDRFAQSTLTKLKNRISDPANVYDERYQKETEITKTGIFMMLTPMLFVILYKRSFYHSEYFSYITLISLTGALIIRAIATIWVIRVAKNQNRNINNWALGALFFPAVSMMVIGLSKKLHNPEEWKKHLYTEKRQRSNAYFHAAISEQYS